MKSGGGHMTFFWGKNAEILFSGWPSYDNLATYLLALLIIFVSAVFVEWLSRFNIIKGSNNVVAGLLQALVHGIRIGLAYLVMLAVMSYNVGTFLAVVGGHIVGFFVFRSRVFKLDIIDVPYEDCEFVSYELLKITDQL